MGGAGIGASGSTTKSGTQAGQQSGINFPIDTLHQIQAIFGPGISEETLLNALPRTTGLFGNNQVGIFPTGGGAPGGGYGYGQPGQAGTPYSYPPGGPSGYGGGQPAGMPAPFGTQPQGGGAAGGGTPGQPNRTFSYGDITAFIRQGFGTNPHTMAQAQSDFLTAAHRAGIDPSQGMTLAQVQQLAKQGGGAPWSVYLNTQLPGLLTNYADLRDPSQQLGIQASGSQGGLDVQGGLSRLGFGQASPVAGPPTIGQPGPINAPQVNGAQANIAPMGFDQYQQNVYQQAFAPVEQQIQRTGTLADRQLNADLASRGLASSGSGIGQLQQARQERQNQLNSASTNAANQASTQRFGAEYAQQQANAQLRQQTAMANAGFDYNAQAQNAQNVLAGDTARSQAYLSAFGLTQQAAQQARGDFLQAMGLQEQDLGRQDQFQQQMLGLILNNWLQQGALVGQLGQQSRGNSATSSISKSGSASASGQVG